MNTVVRYRIIEENIIGIVSEPIENYDLMTAVIICLGKPEMKNYDGILKLLEVLLSQEKSVDEKKTILQNDFGIPMSRTLERKVNDMCNLSEDVWEKGMEKGAEMTNLNNIHSLMETMKLTAEQAMKALKIPEVDWAKYMNML